MILFLFFSLCFAFNPGDVAAPFTVSLLNGTKFSFQSTASVGEPIIMHFYDSNNLQQHFQWLSSNESLDTFLTMPSMRAKHIVMSTASTSSVAASDMLRLQKHAESRMQALRFNSTTTSFWKDHLLFSNDTLNGLNNYFQPLLQEWNTTEPKFDVILHANGNNATFASGSRLNSRYDWLPDGYRVYGDKEIQLVWGGSGCNASVATNFTGKVVLVEVTPGCDAYMQVKSLMKLNATGMISYNLNGSLSQLNCIGNECNDSIYGSGFFAFSIENSVGALLKQLLLNIQTSSKSHQKSRLPIAKCLNQSKRLFRLQSVSMSDQSDIQCDTVLDSTVAPATAVALLKMTDPIIPGTSFAIDGGRKQFPNGSVQWSLRETGYYLYPSLQFLAWADQWLTFQQRLTSELDHITDHASHAKVIPTFQGEAVGSNGHTVSITLPSANDLSQFNRLDLEMELKCFNGTLDRYCPIWDRIVSCNMQCNKSSSIELGRWINPFRRGVGRWLTPASQWLPYFLNNGPAHLSQQCNFTMAILTIDNKFWAPHLNLVFGRDSQQLKPTRTVPLWPKNFYYFNQTYAKNFVPISLPPSTFVNSQKVELVTVITGHGADSNNCAEFCNQTHSFFVNNVKHDIVFDDAGTEMGCANRVLDGIVPNEHGTWLYGRGGWCDGQNVKSKVFDITNDLSVFNNIFMYNATNNGITPNPIPGVGRPAYIDVNVFLTLWN